MRRYGEVASETGRNIADVEGQKPPLKVYCMHNGKKQPKKVAVLLRDGVLISDSSEEVVLTSARQPVQVECTICPRGLGFWHLDPKRLRERRDSGERLDFVSVAEVGVQPPL